MERHTADTCDEDNGNNKEIGIVVKVNALNHLKTADGNETVEGDANTAHNASRNRCKECNEGSEEGSDDCENCCSKNGDYGSITGNSNTADGFAVCGVGATAEESTEPRR